MHKTKASESVRSPSVTPQSVSSKQNMNKKKPPAHTKPRPQDLKNLKFRQKPKKNRTNSITPKTLKCSIYDRVFHNSNLSDTDITSKLNDGSRPQSKVSKSLINRLELTQKVKDLKKPAPFIDQIIKKSLNKAKKQKLTIEKENKKCEIKREIKKNEMNFQNQQIRLENSLKYKKRKKSAKKTEHVKVRSESSSKVRNYASLFIEPAAKNKRSVSIGEYYSNYERRSETAIHDYIEEKNKRRIDDANFEYLHQKAAEISRADRLHNLEIFAKNQRLRSPKIRKNLSRSYSENEENDEKPEEIVERNISFIIDNSDLESVSVDQEGEEDFEDEQLGGKANASDYEVLKRGRNGNLGIYSENDSVEDPRLVAAVIIQRAFRQYLIRNYLKTRRPCLNMHYGKSFCIRPCRKQLKIDPQRSKVAVNPVSRAKKPLKIIEQAARILILPHRPLLTVTKPNFFSILSKKYSKPLKASTQTPISVKSRQKKPSNSIFPQYNFTIFPDKQCKSDSGQLHDQLKEQLAWNSAQVYIIEQLRCEELSLVSTLIENEGNKEKILEKVHKKYQTLLDVMKDAMEFSQSDYLENMTVDEYSKFEKNKQSKQGLLHKVLIDSEETLPKSGFSLNLNLVESSDQGVQPSSDLSSDESEARLGISHSRSLSQLHGDLSQGKYISASQNKETVPTKFPIFFDLDDQIEVQSINLLSGDTCEPKSYNRSLPTLPNLPMLHLDIMQKDEIYSEPRILTSTDSILNYVKGIISNLDFSDILMELKKPLERNIEEELFKLQEKVVGTPSETRIFEFPQILNYQDLLNEDSNNSELESTMRQINKADKIHKKMLVHVLNLQFQQFRPNGFKGKPLTWSNKAPAVPRPLRVGEVTEKVLKDIEIFSLFQIGRIFNEEIITSNGGLDEGLIQSLREDRLERLIYYETFEEEDEWVDYEFEETQVKFDVADMVLEHLSEELEQIFEQIN